MKLTWKRVLAVVLGNLILGVGIALLKISQTGNDPFSAMNMALSESFGIGLGTFQFCLNIVFFIIQLIAGRNYIGIGSLINFVGLGYIVEYSGKGLECLIGDGTAYSFPLQIVTMVLAMLIVSFGLAMYQVSKTGVAPFDYLALGMTDHFPTPYFLNRILTDAFCVLVIVGFALAGIVPWSQSHLGIGTIAVAFGLGPLVNMFTKLHEKWI